MTLTLGRGYVAVTRSWLWRPDWHVTGCCWFWLAWGPFEIGVVR